MSGSPVAQPVRPGCRDAHAAVLHVQLCAQVRVKISAAAGSFVLVIAGSSGVVRNGVRSRAIGSSHSGDIPSIVWRSDATLD
jgi:hypothetical protein